MLGRRLAAMALAMCPAFMIMSTGDVAHADWPAPAMTLVVTGGASFDTVCISGYAPGAAAAQWVVTINGVRDDTSTISVQDVFIAENDISRCYQIYKQGALLGGYTVWYTYAGVGTEVPYPLGAEVVWTGPQSFVVYAKTP